jgi:hypothetical protein
VVEIRIDSGSEDSSAALERALRLIAASLGSARMTQPERDRFLSETVNHELQGLSLQELVYLIDRLVLLGSVLARVSADLFTEGDGVDALEVLRIAQGVIEGSITDDDEAD